jgi:hypothetical protein
MCAPHGELNVADSRGRRSGTHKGSRRYVLVRNSRVMQLPLLGEAERRWTPEHAQDEITSALSPLPLRPESFVLLRWGENITFRLEGLGLVARLSRPSTPLQSVLREIGFARFLEHHQFPAVRLALGAAEQPIITGLGALTLWVAFDGRPGDASDYTRLGVLLRDLHALRIPDSDAANNEAGPELDDMKCWLESQWAPVWAARGGQAGRAAHPRPARG